MQIPSGTYKTLDPQKKQQQKLTFVSVNWSSIQGPAVELSSTAVYAASLWTGSQLISSPVI